MLRNGCLESCSYRLRTCVKAIGRCVQKLLFFTRPVFFQKYLTQFNRTLNTPAKDLSTPYISVAYTHYPHPLLLIQFN